MKQIVISPEAERILCEVVGDDFDKDAAQKKLNEVGEDAVVRILKMTQPVTLAPDQSGPCC